MQKIYYIVYWYKNEIEGHLHCNNNGEVIYFDSKDEVFSYLEELKHKNPDYTFAVRGGIKHECRHFKS